MLTNLFNREGNQTIINVDVASGLHNLGDVLVVEPQNFLITFLHVLVIERELDCVTLLELNLSSAALTPGRESLFILRMKTAARNLHIIILFKKGLCRPHWSLPNLARTHSLDESSPDFWSLGVQSDGDWSVVSRS